MHLEGYWEFPGGKCDPGETLAACLARELREELEVGDRGAAPKFLTTTHDYRRPPGRAAFFRCDLVEGEPSPQLGQEMRWVSREELATLTFPPADGS